MTKRVEYSILAALVGLIYEIIQAADATAPVTEQALLALLLYVLAKLGVEVVGKPVLLWLFPSKFRRYHTPPE